MDLTLITIRYVHYKQTKIILNLVNVAGKGGRPKMRVELLKCLIILVIIKREERKGQPRVEF